MSPLYKIFVSSTFSDLIPYRKAVREAIVALGHHPIMMEDFVASGLTPPNLCAEAACTMTHPLSSRLLA